jgi:hypothetical protein
MTLLVDHAPAVLVLALFVAALIAIWHSRKAAKDHELL